MPPKLSAEMIRARGLLRAGHSAAEAARATGLTKGAISQDAVCREIIDAGKSRDMQLVDKLVGHGVTVKGACAEYDVTPNSYYVWRARQARKGERAAQLEPAEAGGQMKRPRRVYRDGEWVLDSGEN